MTNTPPVNGNAAPSLRDAVGRLAGTVLRSELAGIRDIVLAVRGALDGGGARSGAGPADLQSVALLYVEYLERVTEASWGFRQELERLLTSQAELRPALAYTPTTLELAADGSKLTGAFGVHNPGPAAVEAELAHGPFADTETGVSVEGLGLELSPVAFAVQAGATVAVAVNATGADDVPAGRYRTQLLSLRDLRWPVEVIIPWLGGGAAAPAPAPPATGVDLATATIDDLAGIEGVSRTVATELVAHRDRQGGVLRVKDLPQVRGVGPKLAARIAGQAKPA